MVETAESVSRRMSQQRTRDTKPELILRRALHARGLRYRVDYPIGVAGRRRADVLFPRANIAVFVNGCFWHGCEAHRTAPSSNAEWWRAKLQATQVRDRSTDETLRHHGWLVFRFWEHDDLEAAAATIERAVRVRSEGGARSSERSG